MIAPARQEWCADAASAVFVEVSGNTATSQEHPVRGGHYEQAGSTQTTG